MATSWASLVRLLQLLMVVSVVLERNPELEFQDRVDLDRLVQEAFREFQSDEGRLKEVGARVSRAMASCRVILSVSVLQNVSDVSPLNSYNRLTGCRIESPGGGVGSDVPEGSMLPLCESVRP